MNRIFVTVSGGCAHVVENTVPDGFLVEVVDFDNIGAGDSFPSEDAREYYTKNDLHPPARPVRK